MNSPAPGLAHNIWKYVLFSITSARIYTPVLALYLLSFEDITAATVGALAGAIFFTQFILEVPSGYFADRIGNKRTLVLARILFLVSSLCFFSGYTELFYAAAILFGAGLSLISGTLTAFMNDTLRDLGKSAQYSEIIGKAQSYFLVVSAGLLISTPFFFTLEPSLPFLIAVGLDVIGLIVALSFVSPTQQKDVAPLSVSGILAIVKEAHQKQLVFIMLFLASLSGFILGLRTFQDAYLAEVGVTIMYLGLLFASAKLISALLLRTPLHKLKDLLSFEQFAWLSLAVLLLIALPLGLSSNVALLSVGFVGIFGVYWSLAPMYSHYQLERIGSSSHTATLLSFTSLAGSLALAATSFAIGLSVEWYQYQTGHFYYLLGGTGLLVLLLLAERIRKMLVSS